MPIPLVTRILVADDHPIVRSGLKKVIDAQPDMEVVAEAEDGAEAVKKALNEDVHLAILDVSMPKTTGIQAADELHKRKPELKLLMLSMYDSEQFLFESLKAGASGYVLKSDADQDIVEAVRRTMRGQSFLYPSAISTLVRDFVERGRPDGEQFDVLTLAPGAGSVVLRVVDDGVGLHMPLPQNGAGGLRGMREPAILVGGALAVKAGPGGGVEVRLEVPAAGA